MMMLHPSAKRVLMTLFMLTSADAFAPHIVKKQPQRIAFWRSEVSVCVFWFVCLFVCSIAMFRCKQIDDVDMWC